MNILVTGIAGDIGDGIGRILRGSGTGSRLIGCDVHDRHLGHLVFDECRALPHAESPDYTDTLVSVAREYQVDLIVPTAEAELRLLARRGMFREIEGIPLITANRESLEIGFDKLRTARFLEAKGLNYPWTSLVAEADPLELPCIIKGRFGAGNQQVDRLERPELVDAYRQISPDHIWQEQVGSADQEYTCGVFRSVAQETRVIALRRTLKGGFTTSGEVVEIAAIDRLCREIADALDLEGSINVQLRMTDRGPVVFEINPRFSSTVVFRHLLGFRDLLWSITDRMTGRIGPYEPHATAGTRFFRTFNEVIVGA